MQPARACLLIGLCLCLLGAQGAVKDEEQAAAAPATEVGRPSINAPGGLAPEQTPQFILLTHDDGVDEESRTAMLSVIKGRQNAQGCAATATMFALMDRGGWTQCVEVRRVHAAGMEVADHTIAHDSLPGLTKERLVEELVGARDKIVDCGIPAEDVVGFRGPYLDHEPLVREVLHENGFLYDSSIIEDFTNSVSEGFSQRLWPWDMGFGVPVNCSLVDLLQDTRTECNAEERWPGLWEVPVWRYDNRTAGKSPYAMDPGYNYDCSCMNDTTSVFDNLKAQFLSSYEGSRAPFPVFVHIYWLQAADNLQQLQRFMDWVLEQPDVWPVTMHQLLAWMKNPVPASELTPEALGCGSDGGRPGSLADGEERRRAA